MCEEEREEGKREVQRGTVESTVVLVLLYSKQIVCVFSYINLNIY